MTFLTIPFLGDRYGYRPYPSEIDKEELETLKKALKRKGKSIDVIADWFVLDENAQPAVYVLQPIHSKLPHYSDMTEANSQLAAEVCMNISYFFLKCNRMFFWEIFTGSDTSRGIIM